MSSGHGGSRQSLPVDRFRADAEAAIARDEPEALRELVLAIALESASREWAQSCCMQLARHRDAEVRGNAMIGFGHLARRFGRLEPRVRRIVSIAFVDASASVREKARSAALDLRTFLRWDFEDDPPR